MHFNSLKFRSFDNIYALSIEAHPEMKTKSILLPNFIGQNSTGAHLVPTTFQRQISLQTTDNSAVTVSRYQKNGAILLRLQFSIFIWLYNISYSQCDKRNEIGYQGPNEVAYFL